MTCNAFCKALWDTCKDRVYRLWEHQEFTFSPDDQWVYSKSGRTGIPLAHFEQRWNQLLPHPCPAPADVRLQRNPAPTSVDLAPGSSVQKAAGIQDADSTIELTRSIFEERTREMAYLLLQTCSQDWNKAPFVVFVGALRNCYRLGPKSEEKATEIAAKIRFRWEMGLLTDSIISRFKLPVPNSEICILWNRNAWADKARHAIPNRSDWLRKLYSTLEKGGFRFDPLPDQDPFFERPLKYLAASLSGLEGSEEEIMDVVSEILAFVERTKQFHIRRVLQDDSVRHRIKEWVESQNH